MKQKNSVISITLVTLLLASLCAVCASTSVSAASASGNPIAAGTGPSVCLFDRNGINYLCLFVKGCDGALWYNQDNESATNSANWGWSGWTSLGGKLSSSPCAVSRSSGLIDVYVAMNSTVYERSYYIATWHNWLKVGGKVAPGTGPGVSVWPGREDV